MPTEKKLALVTGAAQGIGAATAFLFAKRGYNIALLDLNDLSGTTTKVTSLGAECLPVRCDVSAEEQVKKSVDLIHEKYHRIDTLLNVAGLALVRPLEETTWDDYRRVLDVNLGGVFLLCKHVSPIMKKSMQGTIVNVASVSGHVGSFYRSVYGASKAAVIAFTRALAWELAPFNIRVNSISPGLVDTDLLRKNMEAESRYLGDSVQDIRKRKEADQAFKRFATVNEVSEAIYFLASDESSFINAVDLPVDSGWIGK